MFETLYKNLNKEQRKAVDTIEGPVMVIAGPGTGKTSILTLRIANILKQTDTSANNILALTFTESGAYAMRKKLVGIIGSAGYKVTIATFHGFCNDIIGQYPERFPRIIGSVSISDIDQIKMMESLIGGGETPLDLLKPYGDPLYYVKPVLGTIRNLKREGVSPEDFLDSIKVQETNFKEIPDLYHEKGAHKGKMKGEHAKLQEKIEKNKELHLLYLGYEKALVKNKFYDYEDMIVEVVKTLRKDPEFLLMLQETYQYILADEHQDANNAQNAVLELLSGFHENPNIFIVGDEKQAIFRFQGASLANFLYFKKLYPDAVLINLKENYRSQQSILDASHSLIEKNVAPKEFERARLTARSAHPVAPVDYLEFSKADIEHAFVASDISEKIKSGTKPEEIAVLYRNNGDAFPMSTALDRIGVPYRIESDQNILGDEHIRKLIIIMKAIGDLSNDEALGKALFVDILKLPILEVYKSLAKANIAKRGSGISLYLIVAETFPDFAKKISSWASVAHNKTFPEFFELIVRESGFLDEALASDQSIERLSILESFFNEVKKMAGAHREYFLKDFIDYLALVEDHGILLKSSAQQLKVGVRLMTAHRSKGLEFEHVYIIGAYDGHWGNTRDKKFFNIPLLDGDGSHDSMEDERRLFYVAITRAKKSVSISYAKQGSDGRERLPTQFINEIAPEMLDTKIESAAVFEKKITENPGAVFAPRIRQAVSFTDRDYIRNLFLEQGFSVTALNNYLKCPWDYFFVNLIRLPSPQSKHQMYGTAVHETLRTFFEKYRESEDMSSAELIELFEHQLNRQPLSPGDYEDSLKKGKESLSGYYKTYKGTWNRNLLTEYVIKGVHIPVQLSEKSFFNDLKKVDVLLKGQLDKIEKIDDRVACVVDYKTGKPKSRNMLEGKTKDADGNYKRQLVFYKLLLDLHDDKFSMKSGELDFIEPDDRGNYKKERFEIIDEEVEELKTTLGRVANEILSFEFIEKGCNEKECDYCKLSKFLR